MADDKPNLGLATTGELVNEILARLRMRTRLNDINLEALKLACECDDDLNASTVEHFS